MIRLEMVTEIAAPVERCFDLARSIDLHVDSTNWSSERAVAGVTSGLIGPGQRVTWKGRHFGIKITHTSEISEYQRPNYFQDRMVNGMFRSFRHDHFFELHPNRTVMRDVMEFEVPLGAFGRIIETLLLERHMKILLERRNQHIRLTAESESWKEYLS